MREPLKNSFFILFFISTYFSTHSQELPADKNATTETVRLYNNLKHLMDKGIMFGHQDDFAYGVGWKYVAGRSDVKDVTGDYPAICGYELGRLEIDHPVNIDSVPFDKIKQFIRDHYNHGGVITLSWHLNNPLTGKTAWDPSPGTVASILPGAKQNELYKSWLDKIASFILSLRGQHNELIPVIFRPFHELNGSWFWWGRNHCTPDELKQLWHFTVTYLRDTKNVHNLLYAFNTDRFSNEQDYLERYPGDEWVDIVGFDIYQKGEILPNSRFIEEVDKSLTTLQAMAKRKNKIPALTEFGYNQVLDSTWWTEVFWKAVQPHKISYVLAWRNAGYKQAEGNYEYYVPYKKQVSERDFVKFFNEEQTLFNKDIEREKLYK